ncbi:MAG: acetyl-CoA C-acyltransferase [Bacteroidia bacterium]|nr:acetyl-CoA C-acyltransferase [Bacteroidia bacterium]
MKEVFIIDGVRTPIGKYAGALATVRPDDLLAFVIRGLLNRNPSLDPSAIEEVFAGAANQSGEDNRNVARMSALLAGLPTTVAGVTVNRLCASGLQAAVEAYRAIRCGEGDCYIASGVESMTRAPFVMAKSETAFGRTPEIFDTTIGWRFVNSALSALHYPYSMGETAENVAEKYNISREAQDEFAWHSQNKYAEAAKANRFAEEILPYPVPQKKGDPILVSQDENPRLSSIEQLAALKPAFKKNGTVTAGNSSSINDGAAALLIVSEETCNMFNLKPKAKIIATAAAGVDPAYMGIGPVPATQKALLRAGLRISDLDLVELNEAFAAQSIPCIQELGLDPSIVNVNGGAIAIGHPLGCSGARILATLMHELHRRNGKYGLATLCVGVGQGLAVIIEKV